MSLKGNRQDDGDIHHDGCDDRAPHADAGSDARPRHASAAADELAPARPQPVKPEPDVTRHGFRKGAQQDKKRQRLPDAMIALSRHVLPYPGMPCPC